MVLMMISSEIPAMRDSRSRSARSSEAIEVRLLDTPDSKASISAWCAPEAKKCAAHTSPILFRRISGKCFTLTYSMSELTPVADRW